MTERDISSITVKPQMMATVKRALTISYESNRQFPVIKQFHS